MCDEMVLIAEKSKEEEEYINYLNVSKIKIIEKSHMVNSTQ